MGKKKFEDDSYSPIKADLLREAAAVPTRAVAEPEVAPPVVDSKVAVEEPPVSRAAPEKVVSIEKPRRKRRPKKVDNVRVGRLSDGPTKRIRVSPEENRQLKGFLARVFDVTDSTVNLSMLSRAGWELAMELEQAFLMALQREPLGDLPSTQDEVAYAAYQAGVKKALRAAVLSTVEE